MVEYFLVILSLELKSDTIEDKALKPQNYILIETWYI